MILSNFEQIMAHWLVSIYNQIPRILSILVNAVNSIVKEKIVVQKKTFFSVFALLNVRTLYTNHVIKRLPVRWKKSMINYVDHALVYISLLKILQQFMD